MLSRYITSSKAETPFPSPGFYFYLIDPYRTDSASSLRESLRDGDKDKTSEDSEKIVQNQIDKIFCRIFSQFTKLHTTRHIGVFYYNFSTMLLSWKGGRLGQEEIWDWKPLSTCLSPSFRSSRGYLVLGP